MFREQTRGLHVLLLLCHWAVVGAVFWTWLFVSRRIGHAEESLALANYQLYYLLFTVGITIGWATERRHASLFRPNFKVATENALWSLMFGCGLLVVYLIANKETIISRLFLFGLCPATYVVMAICYRYLPQWLARKSFHGDYHQRVLVVGDSEQNHSFVPWLEERSGIGVTVAGELALQTDGARPEKLINAEMLESEVRRVSASHVLVSGLPASDDVIQTVTDVCEHLGVRMLVNCDFEKKFRHPVRIFEDGEMRFVGLRKEPLEDPFNRFQKRLLDIVVSLPVVLFVLPPFMLLVWFFQRRESPGPLFYRQRRSGLRSRPFDMLKFRSMHTDHGAESRQATRVDDRIYPAGRWLRKLSIDELPQFLNVLNGDMSVVGPRPHLRQHDDLFAKAMRNYYVRSVVKPGITGLAQVRGFRGETLKEEDISNRVRSDLNYLENWSLELDLSIIFRTFRHMLFPPSTAY